MRRRTTRSTKSSTNISTTTTSKYFNQKTKSGFDSKKEEERWQTLLLEQRAGRISQLERQPKFVLIPAQYLNGKCVERQVVYKADFSYYRNGELVVEDVKSDYTAKLPEYIIKRKLMLYLKKIKVEEIK